MIDIKDIQGNIIYSVPVTQQSQRVEELMASDYIQLSWNSDSNEVIAAGSYIEYNGEKFSLLDPYTPNQKSEVEFEYNPQFKSKIMGWGKLPFFFYTINGDKTAKEPDWTLTGTPSNFMKCICDALLNETGEEWTYTIDASLPASASLSFSSVDILSGLNDIANAFETEWHVDKSTNTIHLEKASIGEEVTLEVGSNIKVPSVNSTKEGYYTRFYAFGSTRNITQDYEGANVNNLVNKRLTLDPQKYPNGYKDIREGLSKGEIFSKVFIFDDVYPKANLSISNVRNRLMYRKDDSGNKIQLGTDEKGNPIYDQYAIWYFKIEGFEYDKENEIEGLKPHVSFQSGALNGREFEVKYHDKFETSSTSDGSFNVYAGEYEIFFVEENNYIIPSMTGLVPSDGDEVVLFNIKMPSEYTQYAYEELEAELDKEIERSKSDLNNYTFDSNPVAFNESNPNLYLGRKVKYVNGDYSYSTRIIKLTTKLDFPIEQNITIGNEKIKGNTQQLKEEVVSANKDLNLLATINEMTQSLQQSYTRTQQMMLEGFAAIKNIWQLKTDENGNTYAFSDFDIATQKGITMYANGGNLDIPSIYDGLPVDWQTIYWEDVKDAEGNVTGRVLKAAGGGGEGGTVNGITLEQLEAYLGVNKYATQTWVEGKGYLSAITSKLVTDALGFTPYDSSKLSGELNNYLPLAGGKMNGDITLPKGVYLRSDNANNYALFGHNDDDVVLVGAPMYGLALRCTSAILLGDDANILTLKRNKSGAFGGLIGVENLDGTYFGAFGFEGLQNRFMIYGSSAPLFSIGQDGTVETTNNIKVNGGTLSYNHSKKYWKLEGDLIVTGGITMFGSDSTFKPSTIMDSIATDNVNLKVVDGVLTFVGQTGGGTADSVLWENVIGRPTLLSSFTDDVVSGKYLSLKGGRMDGDITLNDGAYIRTVNNNNYVILGRGDTSTLLVGAPIYHTSIRGEGVSIGSKTFIEGNGADILTLKRNNTSGGAFVSYKPMNQDDYGWLVGPNTDYDFAFHYYKDNAVTNLLKAMVTPEGDIFTGGSLIVGSVNKADKLVALNVFGKGWFRNGVKLYAGNENVYNTDGITFSSSAGGSVIGRISSDTTGRIGVYPTYSFLARPGYDGSNLVRGLSVDQRGITELICVDSALFNLHVRQSTNGFGAWVRYSSNNQYDKTWMTGVDSLQNYKINYSSDNLNSVTNKLSLSTEGMLYVEKGFDTKANTDGTGGYKQGGITILRNNGADNGGVTLLSGIGGIYIRPNGSTVTTNQSIFPITGGLRIDGAPLATTDKPSIALPFSSYISFGGFHALRGENNAVVLCAPVSESGAIVLRPNGNTSTKHQFSINNLGEAVLTSESAASLTINRTSATGGAYTRYNAANQTTYGWITGSSPNHKYLCQYYNGSEYSSKFELDSSGNGLFYGGVTMYSDIRKKTKLKDVELSLQQIADAPLIEHYYNSDSNKTTHVGSIAQYWAGLNDWFCKLDNEGFYTMEVQNAALASAISIARELQRYELKTDKKIRLLKKRVSELEGKIEELERKGA